MCTEHVVKTTTLDCRQWHHHAWAETSTRRRAREVWNDWHSDDPAVDYQFAWHPPAELLALDTFRGGRHNFLQLGVDARRNREPCVLEFILVR